MEKRSVGCLELGWGDGMTDKKVVTWGSLLVVTEQFWTLLCGEVTQIYTRDKISYIDIPTQTQNKE